ncbi:hypothetical protein PsorP6_007484 [Peronosclerospora sorghi]|uniref:Uncharacterized protein n=1 Tax=Peronosclerospora sorghi TaxID=230839 RepID=A0ACC0WC35_9STRA|nr:hypothetical protein PsorP6_007484 [Peronosclerospora sorghi]
MALTVTDDVRIEATSKYVLNHSVPALGTYRFTYRITMTNHSINASILITLKGLLGREFFKSEKGKRINSTERHSPGIVDMTSLLEPGQRVE